MSPMAMARGIKWTSTFLMRIPRVRWAGLLVPSRGSRVSGSPAPPAFCYSFPPLPVLSWRILAERKVSGIWVTREEEESTLPRLVFPRCCGILPRGPPARREVLLLTSVR